MADSEGKSVKRKQCTCPSSIWVGSEPNNSTCELTEEDHMPDSEVKVPEDLRSIYTISAAGENTVEWRGAVVRELIERMARVEQERDQLRASHAELMEALKDLVRHNWTEADNPSKRRAVEAIKNGSQVQAGNGSSV